MNLGDYMYMYEARSTNALMGVVFIVINNNTFLFEHLSENFI